MRKIKGIMATMLIAILCFSTISIYACYNDGLARTDIIDNKQGCEIKAYNRAIYDSFFPIRDWKKGYDEYDSGIEPYSERGTLAWPMSYYLSNEIIMYNATKDPIYLNRVIDVIDKIFDLRDINIGRLNKHGESPPIWSAGSRYGWGKSILKNEIGEEAVEILTYGKWEIETGIVGELRVGNDTTYISVLGDDTNNTFKIRVWNKSKNFDRTYSNLTLNNEGIIADDDSVRVTVLKASDGFPNNIEEDLIGNILLPCCVHTGLILTPIIQLCKSIIADDLNEYYLEKAASYIENSIAAIGYHDANWVNLDDTKGYYSDAVRGNTSNITPLPWNQMFELGRTLIGLYEITGDEKYKDKVVKMANYYKEFLDYNKDEDLYIWRYWNWDGYKNIESTNYSLMDITFIYECYKAGIGFTEEEMNRFVNTYRKNVYRDNGTISNLIDGRGNYARTEYYNLSRINFLSEWGENYFFCKSIEWIEEIKSEKEYDFGKLLAIAASIYQKRIMDPEWVDITDQKRVGRYRVNQSDYSQQSFIK